MINDTKKINEEAKKPLVAPKADVVKLDEVHAGKSWNNSQGNDKTGTGNSGNNPNAGPGNNSGNNGNNGNGNKK